MQTLWPFGRTHKAKLETLDLVMVEQDKALKRLRKNLSDQQGERLNDLFQQALPKFDEVDKD